MLNTCKRIITKFYSHFSNKGGDFYIVHKYQESRHCGFYLFDLWQKDGAF